MDLKPLEEWVTTEEGAAWLDGQKAPLLKKRDELLETVKQLNGRLAETAQRVNDAEALLVVEKKAVRALVVDDALDRLMDEARVLPSHRDAVKALFASRHDITVTADGQRRKAVVGEQDLSDLFGKWAKSEEAKHFIALPMNVGGGSSGSFATRDSSATWSRERITNMEPEEVAKSLDDPAFRRAVADLSGG